MIGTIGIDKRVRERERLNFKTVNFQCTYSGRCEILDSERIVHPEHNKLGIGNIII